MTRKKAKNRKMKRILALFLTATLLVSSITPIMAKTAPSEAADINSYKISGTTVKLKDIRPECEIKLISQN